MSSEWNQAVKQTFKAGRKTNKFYSLKDAMMDAKKIYRKGANVVSAKMSRKNSRRRKTRGRRMRGGDPNKTNPPTMMRGPSMMMSNNPN